MALPCSLTGSWATLVIAGHFFSTRSHTSSMVSPLLSFPLWNHLFPSTFDLNVCAFPLITSKSSLIPYSGVSSYISPFNVYCPPAARVTLPSFSYEAHINCAGVTCLTVVVPSGDLNSRPPYLAETSFHVPISLFSG